MSKFIDLSGKKFNKLEVLKFSHIEGKNSVWDCICDCGNKTSVKGYNLKSNHTKSCGCERINALKKTATTHGMFGKRFHNIYRQILRRCTEPKHKAFKNYGGRGIKCEWQSFDEFKQDMFRSYNLHVKKYGEGNTTIDRINVEGNYSRKNCRWATWKIQANNKRKI